MMPLKGQMQQRSLTIKVKTTDENPGQTDKNLLEGGGGGVRFPLDSPLGVLVLIKLKLIGTATAALRSEKSGLQAGPSRCSQSKKSARGREACLQLNSK